MNNCIRKQNAQQKSTTEKYSATKRECFAKFHFSQHLRSYFLGQKFLIVTKHRALTWLYSFKDADGLLAIWIEELGQFHFEFKHEAGKKSLPQTVCREFTRLKEKSKTAIK